jgi:hypothetical protein
LPQSDVEQENNSFLESDEGFSKKVEEQVEKQNKVAKFKNPELEAKTNAIQNEYDQLLEEMLNGRKKRDTDGDFY